VSVKRVSKSPLPIGGRGPALLLLSACVIGLSGGGGVWFAGHHVLADALWAGTAGLALIPIAATLIRSLRRHSAGVDVIALLAIVGALVLREYLAGAVIGLMIATGRALEEYAANRAERELSSLLGRAPRVAHRLRDGAVNTVSVEQVLVGDTLIVKEGDVLPVDGIVRTGPAVLDEAALTGESSLMERQVGDQVRSGTANAGAPFHMQATTTAAESTYAGIIRMVREAQASKAPLVRLADRYAQLFVPVTLTVAGAAWLISGDPARGLAVLVVATPCPLLLAAPVAIVSGVSRAARRGIVVKGGAAIETLARGKTLFLDKTGTITLGAPRLQRIAPTKPDGDAAELLRLAASLDQMSSHVLASALVTAARERGLTLTLPTEVTEKAGLGVAGLVNDTAVRVGHFAWVCEPAAPSSVQLRFRRRVIRDEGSIVFVSVGGDLAGAFVFDDSIRPDAPRVLRLLKRRGIEETVMLTGDHLTVAEPVGAAIGVDRVMADLTPEEKVDAVRQSRTDRVTIMVGDGINDAPALAAADVGVAMGARGATSSSEAADVVLVVDRLDRLVEAVEIAQRTRSIAIQSMWMGMGLSLVAMGGASLGLLSPVLGAVAQEAIDAAAILNALRALRGRRDTARPRLPVDVVSALRSEHRGLLPRVDEFRELADRLDDIAAPDLRGRLELIRESLVKILAHERADEQQVYKTLAATLGGDDPLAAMSRTHQEIFHLARVLERLIAGIPLEGPDPEDLVDVRRTLYALHTVLRLNIAQEDQLYLSLDPEAPSTP
jgi:heavy metal translocating P-type ATPase